MVKVFIDSGHGGKDSGAIGNGLKEKDLCLKITKGIMKELKKYDVDVKVSRNKDLGMSLSKRTDMANKWGADVFISVHINAGGGTGFESFIYNGNVSSNTIKYRNILHDEIMKVLKVKNRGKKRQNFHVLRESKMPAILTENLFIDNKTDADNLKNDKFIDKIIKGHVNGIKEIFNLKEVKNKSTKNKFYRVVTGSFNSKKNAEKQVKLLKDKGFKSFIDVYKK